MCTKGMSVFQQNRTMVGSYRPRRTADVIPCQRSHVAKLKIFYISSCIDDRIQSFNFGQCHYPKHFIMYFEIIKREKMKGKGNVVPL